MDKDTLFYKKHTMACRGKLLGLDTPLVMGILNLTPDSFYDGGVYSSKEDVLARVAKMVSEGADIIDIGACSSRPGAENIDEEKELHRLEGYLGPIRENFPDIVISVDTFRARVADKVIQNFNVDIINDISGGGIDPEIIDVVTEQNAPYILMHIQGTPQSMQKNPEYNHVVKDILEYFVNQVSRLRDKGLNDIIIDPGFGFGKTIGHNYQLLAGLDVFQMLELPILVGISRKSMIYNFLGTTPQQALPGTIALNVIALQKGASILRVHDVREAKETISICKKLSEESEKSINLLNSL